MTVTDLSADLPLAVPAGLELVARDDLGGRLPHRREELNHVRNEVAEEVEHPLRETANIFL